MTLPASIFSPAQLAYLIGIAAVLGACLGSFINCAAWRMVNGESALRGRSHCATCNHVLGPLDLIPIVSWFALRGKCRYCGERVSPRYMLVEVLMALLFAALFLRFGFGVQTLAYAVLACILLGLSLVDLDTFTIPNGFIIAGCVVWAASVAFMPVPQAQVFSLGSLFAGFAGYTHLAVILDGIAGFLITGAFVLLVSLVMDAVLGRQSLGGGDIKLLAMLGLYLGVAGSFVGLFFACIFGIVFAFLQPAFSRNAPGEGRAGSSSSQDGADAAESKEAFRTKTIPFGPSIALASCASLLFGWQILSWYIGLL